MIYRSSRSILAVALVLTSSVLVAQNTTTTVSATPTSAVYGTAINLSAVVSSGTGESKQYRPGDVVFADHGVTIGTAASSSDMFSRPTTIPLTQLTGTVGNTLGTFLTGDVNGDGRQDLISYAHTTFQVFLNAGDGTYTAMPVNTSSIVSPVLIDYDGDGKIDILSVAEAGSGPLGEPTGLTVLLGDGTGTFHSPTAQSGIVLPANANVTALTVGDFTGQGGTDLAVFYNLDNMFSMCVAPSCEAGAHVSIYAKQGTGSFALRGTTILPDTQSLYSFVSGVQIADFNGDSRPDLVIAAQRYGAGSPKGIRIDVLLSNGDGTFTRSTAGLFDGTGSGCNGAPFAIGDFGNRGKNDLVVSYIPLYGTPYAGQYQLLRFAGYGDGTFAAGTVIATPSSTACSGTAAVDLDEDGKLDIVEGSGLLLHGKGDGSFNAPVNASPMTMQPPFTAIYATGPVVTKLLPGKNAVIFNGKGSTPAAIPVLLSNSGRTAVLPPVTNLAAGDHFITASYAGSGSFSGSTSPAVTVTISKQSSTTIGSASSTSAVVMQPVTLTVKVTAGSLVPTGTVTFTVGNTALGTAVLDASGSASISYAFATVGTQTITASYGGDAGIAASTATITVSTVNAFTVSSSSGNTSLTAPRGGSATSTIVVSPQTGFSGVVSFACSNLPAGATCSFAPATVTVSGTAAANTTMTVSVGSSISTLRRLLDHGGLVLAGGFFCCLAGVSRRRRIVSNTLLVLAVSAVVIGSAGCGGSNVSASASPKTFNFNVVATSGSAQTTTAYTLNVQ